MTDASEVEREEYGELSEGQSSSQYQEATNDLTVKPYCDTDSCTAKQEEPAEAAWVKLMSAVPQAGQIDNLRAAREGTMMLPEGKTIQSMVASIRPQPEADYALDTIRDEWIDFYEEFRIVGPKLEQGLVGLSSGWKGEDFDGFEEQVETVIKNCRTIQHDIGGEDGADGVIKVLDTKQSEIFDQQGGTACVYPAPKFYMEGTSCGSHRIHIRPPFYKNCVIEENDEIKHAVELAGFDPTVVDEVQEGRQQRYDSWMEYVTNNPDYEEDGLKGEELARKKADDYADQRLIQMGAEGSEQLEEQAAIVNEEVTERHSNVEAQVTEIEPDVGQSEPTTFEEGMTDMPGTGGLDTGGGGGLPDLGGGGGGLDDMTSPNDLNDLGGGPNGFGSNSSFSGGTPGGGDLPPSQFSGGQGLDSLSEENPFNSGLEDPDNLGNTRIPGSGQVPGGLGDGSFPSGNPGDGLPPSEYTGGQGLDGLDPANPWDPSDAPDPDEISGGLAGGGTLGGNGTPPSGFGGGGLGGNGGGITGYSGGGGGIVGPTRRRSSPINAGSGANRPSKLTTGPGGTGLTGSGRPGSPGGAPGSGGRGSGLGSGGIGGGRGGLGGSGTAGRGGGGVHGMIPAGGGRGGPQDDEDNERKVWMAEEEEIWGGSPEDEEDDPFA